MRLVTATSRMITEEWVNMKKTKTYEKLLGYILIVSIICGIISSLTGCAYTEVDTKVVIDYRFTSFHEEQKLGTRREYNHKTEEWVTVQYIYTDYVPDTYELLWEYTYMDGHKERKWEECTRFEYQNAKEELGE